MKRNFFSGRNSPLEIPRPAFPNRGELQLHRRRESLTVRTGRKEYTVLSYLNSSVFSSHAESAEIRLKIISLRFARSRAEADCRRSVFSVIRQVKDKRESFFQWFSAGSAMRKVFHKYERFLALSARNKNTMLPRCVCERVFATDFRPASLTVNIKENLCLCEII